MSALTRSKADLHLHSDVSDGEASPEAIVERAVEVGLRVIAVTDHDTFEGGIRAYQFSRAKGWPIAVLVGQEKSTNLGHVVFLFPDPRTVPRTIPNDFYVAARVARNYDGLIVLPHPGYPLHSVPLRVLPLLVGSADAIEALNGWSFGLGRFRIREDRIPSTLPLARIGSSDAHQVKAIGSVYTEFEGADVGSLCEAIRSRRTVPVRTNTETPSLLELLKATMKYNRRRLLGQSVLRFGPWGGPLDSNERMALRSVGTKSAKVTFWGPIRRFVHRLVREVVQPEPIPYQQLIQDHVRFRQRLVLEVPASAASTLHLLIDLVSGYGALVWQYPGEGETRFSVRSAEWA